MSDGLSIFDDDPTPQRAAESTKSRRRRKPLIIALSVLLVILLGGGLAAGWYLHRVNSALSNIERQDWMPSAPPASGPSTAGPAPSVLPKAQGLNYVLMGTDTKAGDAGRSDSLMVAHVTADRKKIYLISFPRDLWVDIPGHGKGKINWAYAFGGPELTIRTLNDLIGVKMDHAAVVDFDGFMRLTDALGGVEVFNKRAFHGRQMGGHDFPAGMITLKGDAALAYVRERYALPNGDLDRAENQRDVVRAILNKAAQPSVLANPVAIDALFTQLSGSIKVDSGLTNDVIRETAMSMRLSGGNDIVSFQAPMKGFGWAGDQAIAIVDESQMAELGKALREDRLDDYLARFPKSCTGGSAC